MSSSTPTRARFWPGFRSSFWLVLNFAAPPFALLQGRDSRRRQRAESAAAVPGDGDSSADAVPGLRGLLGSLRLCAGRADDALPRRKMDQDHPRLDDGDLAVSDLRHLPGHALGLRGAGLGRLLGLGPGGECQLHALAHRHRLSALGDDAGEERHDEELECLADLLHLPAHHCWARC